MKFSYRPRQTALRKLRVLALVLLDRRCKVCLACARSEEELRMNNILASQCMFNSSLATDRNAAETDVEQELVSNSMGF
jgi:hypothetical protein